MAVLKVEGEAVVSGEGTGSAEHFAQASRTRREVSIGDGHAGLIEGDRCYHVSARRSGWTVGDGTGGGNSAVSKSAVGHGSSFGLEEGSSCDTGCSVGFTASVLGRGSAEL